MTDPKTESKKDSAERFLNEQFPINVLCNFINPYRGDRETLTAFLTNCQNALDLASPTQRTLLFKFIIAKLEGKAQIACSNKLFENFDALKAFLKQNFGERKHYTHLLLDLQSCKQQSNESVSQFALRVESCLTDLQSEIHNSDSLKRDLPGRIAMTEDLALYTFFLGLHPRLSNNVRCRNPKTLNGAINIALEEEKIQNLLFKTIVKAKCKICGKPGHSESECSKRYKQMSQPHSSFEPQPSTSQHLNSQVSCRYCKKPGHDITQCRKRKYNNEKYKNSNNQGIHHISYESPPSSVSSPTLDQGSRVVDGEFDDNLN